MRREKNALLHLKSTTSVKVKFLKGLWITILFRGRIPASTAAFLAAVFIHKNLGIDGLSQAVMPIIALWRSRSHRFVRQMQFPQS
jgi:hypothetical protein